MSVDDVSIEDIVQKSEHLALIVEDNDVARLLKSELLKSCGFSVISVANEDEAEKEFINSPAITFALVDINLHADNRSDRSGEELARKLRYMSPDLPIVGYSAIFAEDEVVNRRTNPFTSTFARGSATPNVLAQHLAQWVDMASRYSDKRAEVARGRLTKLRAKHARQPINFDVVRLLVPKQEGEIIEGVSSVEDTLRAAGYRLRVIDSSSSRPTLAGPAVRVCNPVLVWIKNAGDHFVAEIYGYSELYSIGGSEEEAISSLLLLMDGFLTDLVGSAETIGSERLNELASFLKRIFLAT